MDQQQTTPFRMHVLQHVAFEGPGVIERWAYYHHFTMTTTHMYKDEPLPPVAEIDMLVVPGGPMNVYDDVQHPWLTREKQYIKDAITAGKYVVGVCLGAQLIAVVLGAQVRKNAQKEIGWFPVERLNTIADTPFDGLSSAFPALHWHEDTFDIPEGAVLCLKSEACTNQAFVYGHRVLAMQFHLEMTQEGAEKLAQQYGALKAGPFVQELSSIMKDEKVFGASYKKMYAILNALVKIKKGGYIWRKN